MTEECKYCGGEIVSEVTRQEYRAYDAYCEEKHMPMCSVNFCECVENSDYWEKTNEN